MWKNVEIVNGSLSGEYITHGAGEVSVANGWFPWWKQGTQASILHRPEFCKYKEWQKVFTGHATHKGGIYQRVQVAPGAKLMLLANAWFSSDRAGMALVVGIDEQGGVPERPGEDPPSTVKWGTWAGETSRPRHPERTPMDYSVAAIAQSNYVTLYLRGECTYPGPDASAFWNNVRLMQEVESDPGPGPNPGPNPDLQQIIFYLARIDANLERLVEQECQPILSRVKRSG